MITKFKHMLGIEGAKLKIILDDDSRPEDGVVSGQVELTSLKNVSVSDIYLKIEERYERGRGQKKLIDKYLLAERDMPIHLDLLPNTPVLIPFELSFERVSSPADEFASRNLLNSALMWTAKKLKKVRSSYMLTVEAVVDGTRLNPFDSVELLSE